MGLWTDPTSKDGSFILTRFNVEYHTPLCVWVGNSKQTPLKSGAFMYSVSLFTGLETV